MRSDVRAATTAPPAGLAPQRGAPLQARSIAIAGAVYAGFLALTLWAYRGLWGTFYYKDDYHWMSIAQEMARAPWRLLVSDPDNGAAGVRAVQRTVFGLLYRGFGSEAAAYHVTSLLLHALNATLVFFLLRRLLRDVREVGARGRLALAAFGAFVFATTSLHSAAVVWLASMSTLLVTAAVIVLFRAVLAFETQLDRGRLRWGIAALFLLVLACKNTAASFPLVLASWLFVWSPARQLGRGRWHLLLVLGGVAVVQLGVTKLVFARVDLAHAFGATGAYALSTNVPLNVLGAFMGNLMAPRTYEAFAGGIPYPYIAFPLLLASLAILRGLPQARTALLGTTWILLAALPVALFDYQQYSGEQVMVSRYYYLPLVGGCILGVFLILGLLQAAGSLRWLGLTLILLAAAHGGLHLPALQGAVRHMESYGSSRLRLYDSTLDAVRKRDTPEAQVYALDWPVPENALPHIGRHFFAPHGVLLRGPRDFVAWQQAPVDDGRSHYAAHWDAQSSALSVRRVTASPDESGP